MKIQAFLFPVSLPRKLTALRSTSALSVMISIYIMLVIVIECLLDRGTSPTISDGFKEGREKAEINATGIFNSLPLVIFGYMYQVNIPAIYNELEKPSMSSMKKVLAIGTTLAAVGYIFAGMFGYVAFAAGESEVELKDVFATGNILQAPWYMPGTKDTPVVIYISLFGICLVVLFATPFSVLPTKDAIEEVSGKKITKTMNVVWTAIILLVSMGFSLLFKNLTTVMAFLGATTNSAIGFLFPIAYYWHVEKN